MQNQSVFKCSIQIHSAFKRGPNERISDEATTAAEQAATASYTLHNMAFGVKQSIDRFGARSLLTSRHGEDVLIEIAKWRSQCRSVHRHAEYNSNAPAQRKRSCEAESFGVLHALAGASRVCAQINSIQIVSLFTGQQAHLQQQHVMYVIVVLSKRWRSLLHKSCANIAASQLVPSKR